MTLPRQDMKNDKLFSPHVNVASERAETVNKNIHQWAYKIHKEHQWTEDQTLLEKIKHCGEDTMETHQMMLQELNLIWENW